MQRHHRYNQGLLYSPGPSWEVARSWERLRYPIKNFRGSGKERHHTKGRDIFRNRFDSDDRGTRFCFCSGTVSHFPPNYPSMLLMAPLPLLDYLTLTSSSRYLSQVPWCDLLAIFLRFDVLHFPRYPCAISCLHATHEKSDWYPGLLIFLCPMSRMTIPASLYNIATASPLPPPSSAFVWPLPHSQYQSIHAF